MQLIRFRVDLAPRCSLGPGKIALLEAIADKGSLTHAAAKLGMSYRYAWLLLEDLRRSFSEPVTRATVGGRRGGGVDGGEPIVRSSRLERLDGRPGGWVDDVEVPPSGGRDHAGTVTT